MNPDSFAEVRKDCTLLVSSVREATIEDLQTLRKLINKKILLIENILENLDIRVKSLEG